MSVCPSHTLNTLSLVLPVISLSAVEENQESGINEKSNGRKIWQVEKNQEELDKNLVKVELTEYFFCHSALLTLNVFWESVVALC